MQSRCIIVYMHFSGRKIIFASSSLITLLSFPNLLYANEASGSVVNEVNISNSTSGGSSTGRTDIVIECNGVKKEYHSDKAKNVSLSCDDETSGTVKSEVKIRNNSSITPNPTISEKVKQMKEEVEKKKEEIKKEVKTAKDKVENERKDLFEIFTTTIRDIINSIF